MGYHDVYNSRKIADFLNGIDAGDVCGYHWHCVGKLRASYIDFSGDRIKVTVHVEVTGERVDNSEVSSYISHFVNKQLQRCKLHHPQAMSETPPRIELVIAKQ